MDRTVTVSGHARVAVAPDIARLRCGVQVLAKQAHDALRRCNEAMAAILDSVVVAGVDRSDLVTSGPRLHPTDRGYHGSNDVTVVIRDLTAVGAIVDSVVADGGPDVTMHGITFDVVDPAAHLPPLRAAAMADARAVAEQFAAAGGASVGDVITIVDAPGGPIAPPPMRARAMAAATPVEAGEQELAVSVTVTFALG